MVAPHRLVWHHIKRLHRNATPPKYIVTAGVIVASVCAVQGYDHGALWASIATNIIWIWE